MTQCGVIDSSGNLLRAGKCDFEGDGSFDGANETQREDVPHPAKLYGEETPWHRYTTQWDEVSS